MRCGGRHQLLASPERIAQQSAGSTIVDRALDASNDANQISILEDSPHNGISSVVVIARAGHVNDAQSATQHGPRAECVDQTHNGPESLAVLIPRISVFLNLAPKHVGRIGLHYLGGAQPARDMASSTHQVVKIALCLERARSIHGAQLGERYCCRAMRERSDIPFFSSHTVDPTSRRQGATPGECGRLVGGGPPKQLSSRVPIHPWSKTAEAASETRHRSHAAPLTSTTAR